nr:PEP/pyruvate-binding domain-containing protein [Aminivibrio sp.]
VKELCSFLEERMGMPADMEFAYDTEREKLTLLQLRPLASYEEMARVAIPEVRDENVILKGNRMVSNGKLENVHHLVYVDPSVYGKDATFYEVAREIGRINHKLSGTNYILVGPGRWGSTNPKLGVPVRYNEICNCGCLVEVGILESDYTPELSYGTHFFLDLDVDGTLYLPVFDGMKGNIYNREWLGSSFYEQKRHPAVRHYTGNFSVLLDGENEVGVVISNEPQTK